jgi:hypothetical protein
MVWSAFQPRVENAREECVGSLGNMHLRVRMNSYTGRRSIPCFFAVHQAHPGSYYNPRLRKCSTDLTLVHHVAAATSLRLPDTFNEIPESQGPGPILLMARGVTAETLTVSERGPGPEIQEHWHRHGDLSSSAQVTGTRPAGGYWRRPAT